MTDTTSAAPRAKPIEFALLGLLALLWGSSYLFGKVAVSEIPPLTVVAGRVSIATVILAAVMAVRRDAWPSGRRIWAMLLLQAVFNSIGSWTVLAWAQQHIDASLASVLNSTAPIFVFLMTALAFGRSGFAWMKLLGTTVGIVGVALIVGVGRGAGEAVGVWGPLAALFGAFLYACAAIYGRRFAELSPTATAAGTMLWATVALAPAALIIEQPWRLSPSVEALTALVVLGVACTGVALLLYFRLLRTLGPLGVASQSYLRAGIGALLGVAVLGESLSTVALIGMGLAVLGVAAMNAPARRRPLAGRARAP